MKTECPYCSASQNIVDDMASLPLPCKKCGQTFIPAEANLQKDARQLVDDDEQSQQDSDSNGPSLVMPYDDWIADPECIAAGISRVAHSYFSLIVTVIGLATISVADQFYPEVVRSPFILLMVIGGGIVFLISLFLWFNGQVQLRKGHPRGSALHEAISRSLSMSVLAIVARVAAKVLSLSLLKGVGGLLSMAAFDRLLLYFELLCIELGEDGLRMQVSKLSRFYRWSLTSFVGFLLLYAFAGIPLGVPPWTIFIGVGALAISLFAFSIWFASLLQSVRRAVELRLYS
ncbi:MAG: hypothetical protein ABJZ55_16255 [Fuerstiella sp.]